MPGKDPQRSCVFCRNTRDKKELLRFVLAPDRSLVPDLLSKLPGRGAYTCLNRECLHGAARKGQFDRAFKGVVKFDGADQLVDQLISKLEERIGSYISLANKAGKVVSGSDLVMESIRKRKSGFVFIAIDISKDIGAKVMEMADIFKVPHTTVFNKDRLGAFIGKGLRSVVSIEHGGFVHKVAVEVAKYRNFLEGGTDAR
jgi:predicted RNA-binding protein YlxR (DUF448 family)/ribosomal protein L30E